MRTNIVLNEDLIREAKKYSRSTTKRALLEEALNFFVKFKSSEQKTLTYKDRISDLNKKLVNLQLRESPLKVIRESREKM